MTDGLDLVVQRAHGVVAVTGFVRNVPVHLFDAQEGTSSRGQIDFEPVTGFRIQVTVHIESDVPIVATEQVPAIRRALVI